VLPEAFAVASRPPCEPNCGLKATDLGPGPVPNGDPGTSAKTSARAGDASDIAQSDIRASIVRRSHVPRRRGHARSPVVVIETPDFLRPEVISMS
jgi:hypothetical protein